jgi:type II secretion system protein J
MNIRVRQPPRAFTIIEIMAALALFGLIIAAVYSSWIAIVRGSETGKKAAARVQRSRVVVRTFEQALTSARSFAADIQYYGFVAENGDDAVLSFVAKLPRSFPRSGRFGDFDVRRVTFSLEPGPVSGKELVLRQNPLLMDWDIDEKEHPVVLAENVKAFEMEFKDLRTGDWLDEWTQTNQLPRLVKITLKWGGQSGFSKRPEEEITRIISVPSLTVPPGWQAPGVRPGGPPPPPPPPPPPRP